MERGPVSAPADFLRDPRFDYVAWVRDPILAHGANQADSVSDVIYEYIENGYRFHRDLKGHALVNILYPLRNIRPDGHPIWKLRFFKFLQKQFPQNVTQETLALWPACRMFTKDFSRPLSLRNALIFVSKVNK
jgi:hypothetical protein